MRLNQGRFAWPNAGAQPLPALTREQFEALVLGLPWQRLEQMRVITRLWSEAPVSGASPLPLPLP